MNAEEMERQERMNSASLAVRQARAKLKKRARDGHVSVAEVVIAEADVMGAVRLADIVGWGWPRIGPMRQVKVGKLAARRDLNLMLTVGAASRASRQLFADLMWEVRGEPQAVATVLADQVEDDERDRLQWLLSKAERERDVALQKVEDMERTATVQQCVMPTMQAELMLADLADAVEQHRRTVTSPSSAAEKWATADEVLWARKNAILASDAPVLQSVA